MTSRTKLLLGIVGAAAAGAAIALLLAPEKGTDVRRKISKTAGDWGSQLSDLFANAKDELANIKKKGAKMTKDMSNRYTGATENFS